MKTLIAVTGDLNQGSVFRNFPDDNGTKKSEPDLNKNVVESYGQLQVLRSKNPHILNPDLNLLQCRPRLM